MKNKTIAFFGIVTYILSVITSATDLEGNFRFPAALIAVSGILTVIFIILATIRLWRKAKKLSITFASSASILFILTAFQEFIVSSYGSPVVILTNIAKVVYIGAFIFVVVRFFKMKEEIVS